MDGSMSSQPVKYNRVEKLPQQTERQKTRRPVLSIHHTGAGRSFHTAASRFRVGALIPALYPKPQNLPAQPSTVSTNCSHTHPTATRAPSPSGPIVSGTG
jgi:hypothetical protein